MDYTIAPNVTAIGSGDAAPVSGAKGEFTSGNPATNTPATTLPGYQMNALVEEILNVITAAGITPNNQVNSQLLQAIFSLKNVQVFTSSGAFTVPASVTKVKATVVGAGGAGGNAQSGAAAGGGGGGGISVGIFAVTPGASYTVTVGAGGTSGTANNSSGNSGGTSSFGSLCSATGGTGGVGVSSGGGGAFGTFGEGTGGILNLSASPGASGLQIGTTWFGGQGGAALMFSAPSWGSPSGGVTGNAYGGGGGGGANGATGGSGGPGIVIVEW